MTQMTAQQLAARDAFVAKCKLTEGVFIRDMIERDKSDLAALTDPDEAVLLYLNIQESYGLLDEVSEPFEALAPLVKLEQAAFDAVKVRATAKKVIEDKESRREIYMKLSMRRVKEATAKFGFDSDECRMEMAKAIEFLPDDVKTKLDAKARELGLMPPASGYTADGEPVFTVEALAKHFGMDPEEVMQDAGEFSMTVDASSIHRPQ